MNKVACEAGLWYNGSRNIVVLGGAGNTPSRTHLIRRCIMDSLYPHVQDSNPTKPCSKCKRDLPLTTEYFKRHKNHKDGLYSQCKQCCNKKEQRPDSVDISFERCSACKEWLQPDNFYRNKDKSNGLNSWCKSCMNKNKIEKRKNTPHVPHLYRTSDLLRHRGISVEIYDQMLQAQEGLCAACHQPEREIHPLSGVVRHFAVDHDHETGIIRGLLCNNCNRVLGMVKDNAHLLRALSVYIEYHQEKE